MAQQLRAQTVFHGQLSSVLSTHTTACNLRSRGSSVLSWPLWHCTHSETHMWIHMHTHKNNWKNETKHWLLNNSEDHARIKCKIITHGKNSKRTFRNILRCLKKLYNYNIALSISSFQILSCNPSCSLSNSWSLFSLIVVIYMYMCKYTLISLYNNISLQ